MLGERETEPRACPNLPTADTLYDVQRAQFGEIRPVAVERGDYGSGGRGFESLPAREPNAASQNHLGGRSSCSKFCWGGCPQGCHARRDERLGRVARLSAPGVTRAEFIGRRGGFLEVVAGLDRRCPTSLRRAPLTLWTCPKPPHRAKARRPSGVEMRKRSPTGVATPFGSCPAGGSATARPSTSQGA
jgi:hypothetical protein